MFTLNPILNATGMMVSCSYTLQGHATHNAKCTTETRPQLLFLSQATFLSALQRIQTTLFNPVKGGIAECAVHLLPFLG
jgi:hypothetical protein